MTEAETSLTNNHTGDDQCFGKRSGKHFRSPGDRPQFQLWLQNWDDSGSGRWFGLRRSIARGCCLVHSAVAKAESEGRQWLRRWFERRLARSMGR